MARPAEDFRSSTEWRRRPLTPEQIRYAVDDGRYLLRLYEKLNAKLTKLGRVGGGRGGGGGVGRGGGGGGRGGGGGWGGV